MFLLTTFEISTLTNPSFGVDPLWNDASVIQEEQSILEDTQARLRAVGTRWSRENPMTNPDPLFHLISCSDGQHIETEENAPCHLQMLPPSTSNLLGPDQDVRHLKSDKKQRYTSS